MFTCYFIIWCSHLKSDLGTSLAVQWLRLHASNAGGMGSIPGLGTKIPMLHSMVKQTKGNKQNKNKQIKINK